MKTINDECGKLTADYEITDDQKLLCYECHED